MLVEADVRVALFPGIVTHILIKTACAQASAGINTLLRLFCVNSYMVSANIWQLHYYCANTNHND